MSDARKMKQIWNKFSKLKAEIMMWKMREPQRKKLALGKNYRDLQSQIHRSPKSVGNEKR